MRRRISIRGCVRPSVGQSVRRSVPSYFQTRTGRILCRVSSLVNSFIHSFIHSFPLQRSCKCDFMYGDSTDSEMALKIDKALEMQTQESVEILVYQKSSKSTKWLGCSSWRIGRGTWGHLKCWLRSPLRSSSIRKAVCPPPSSGWEARSWRIGPGPSSWDAGLGG